MVETIDKPSVVKKGRLAHVPLTCIVMGSNPRTHFDDQEQFELNATVKALGVMTPIILRDLGDGLYQLVAGERRYHAAKLAFGESYEIPANIFDMDDMDEAAALIAALVENIARAGMSPAEEARGCAKLLAEFAGDRNEVARHMGLKPEVVARRLALMNASDNVLDALTKRVIKLGHAELLAAAPKAAQDGALAKLLAMPSIPSVETLKESLIKIARPLASACFDKTECQACPNNSDTQRAMFSEAIDSGNCTNGECFTAKTEAVLLEKKASLVENYPRVEIVREGDNYSVIKLVVEGPKGVGEEQGKACLGCANFGAAVSAIPGKEGKVYEQQCFDTGCNTRMVAKHSKATAEAAAEAAEASSAGGSNAKKGSPTAKKGAKVKPKAKAKASAVSAGVVDFRKKVWRTALRTELQTGARKSIQMLIAICLADSARQIQGSDIDLTPVPGLSGNSVLEAIQAMNKAEGAQISATVASIAFTALDSLDNRHVTDALKAFEVDLAKTFSIDETYLKLLTKSEITAVAKEVGLETAYGKEFGKLMLGKKDDAIKSLLAVKDFDFHVVPGQLAYQ
ncbi:MAG: PRTRC system ParB family protein [Polaromonas sp.]|uniref:PRTRC system ParB family protein n=1 Tax=Polaromonas sp. TaxID=1869339 RepID=UPI00248A044F|nr:PRTRC system ParB family protein [Polaromonas sp.]MDI1236421.1 PRTRC system ParB family protein [Polaromonas sp.]